MRVLSGKQLCLKHQIPFGRLTLKIYCVLSFMEDVGKCLDPGNEIAGGEARQTWGLLWIAVGSGNGSQEDGQWRVF